MFQQQLTTTDNHNNNNNNSNENIHFYLHRNQPYLQEIIRKECKIWCYITYFVVFGWFGWFCFVWFWRMNICYYFILFFFIFYFLCLNVCLGWYWNLFCSALLFPYSYLFWTWRANNIFLRRYPKGFDCSARLGLETRMCNGRELILI